MIDELIVFFSLKLALTKGGGRSYLFYDTSVYHNQTLPMTAWVNVSISGGHFKFLLTFIVTRDPNGLS